jgi:hypothetical protein
MILTWHEDAEEEYASAAVYYERQVEDLGERFIEQVEATLASEGSGVRGVGPNNRTFISHTHLFLLLDPHANVRLLGLTRMALH